MLLRPGVTLTQLSQMFSRCAIQPQNRVIHVTSKQLHCAPSISHSKLLCTTDIGSRERRLYSSSRNFESESPYKGDEPQLRSRYKYPYFQGGVLPRPKELQDKRIEVLPEWDPRDKDAWTTKKALFGQNDYIDILGDGSVHPKHLLTGPAWIRGFKGNEYQRIVRRFAFEGQYLKEFRPKKYHELSKHLFFLYKKFNRRRRSKYWGRGYHARPSRTDKYNKSWYY